MPQLLPEKKKEEKKEKKEEEEKIKKEKEELKEQEKIKKEKKKERQGWAVNAPGFLRFLSQERSVSESGIEMKIKERKIARPRIHGSSTESGSESSCAESLWRSTHHLIHICIINRFKISPQVH
jgi:outer membrane biosynthesis protein TonB